MVIDGFQPCLGIEVFGLCRYDPLNPANSYFSIGEAVSTFALLIAASQLAGPVLQFRLRISRAKVIAATGLFTLTIICAGVAAAIPSVLGYTVPVVGFPIFWELLGLLGIVIGGFILVHLYFRPAIYSETNFEAYFNACLAFISRGDPQFLRALADELAPSVEALVSACSQHDFFEARKAEENHQAYPLSPVTSYGLECLNLLADERFCKVVVEYCPETAVLLITKISESSRQNMWGRSLVHQLIRQALINPNSIMHREDNHSGLGRFKSFTKSVFGTYAHIDSFQRPLKAWEYWRDEENTTQILQKYALALEMAFSSYFEAADYWTYPAALAVGVQSLVGSAQFKLPRLRLEEGEWISDTPAFKSWQIVSETLLKLIETTIKNDERLPNYEFDSQNYDRSQDPSIYGVIAEGVYEFLEKLSMYRKDDHAVRSLAIRLWMDVAPANSRPAIRPVLEIQKRLAVHLRNMVEKNLVQGYYPALTRVLISLIGLHAKQDGEDSRFFTSDFHSLMRKHFLNAHRTDSVIAEDMLPKGVTLDESGQRLVIERRWRKGTEQYFSLA